MSADLIVGGALVVGALAWLAVGVCRAAARPMPAPDHAAECPDFIEHPDAPEAEDGEWLLLLAEVEGDWLAWEREVSA